MIIYPDDGLLVYWKHADSSESTDPSMAPGSLLPFLTQKNQRKLRIFQTNSVTFQKGYFSQLVHYFSVEKLLSFF